jgi:hypothetical protein
VLLGYAPFSTPYTQNECNIMDNDLAGFALEALLRRAEGKFRVLNLIPLLSYFVVILKIDISDIIKAQDVYIYAR